jgi:hypothetical protein
MLKRYYKIKGETISDRFGEPVENLIKVHMAYQLGGMNYFQGQQDARGYYLHVGPIERGKTFESFTLSLNDKGSFKVFIKEVKRKSKGGLADAERMALETLDKYLGIICERMGIELTGEYEDVQPDGTKVMVVPGETVCDQGSLFAEV